MDSDEDTSGPGEGVRLPDYPVTKHVFSEGYTSIPVRQPIGPPQCEGGLHKHAGFAKFLKTHLSPRHKRVTAGGRIVPVTKTPPPTFHMEFIDQVVKASEDVQHSLGNLIEGNIDNAQGLNEQLDINADTLPQPGSESPVPASRKIDDPRISDPSLATSAEIEIPRPMILDKLPKGFEVQQVYDDRSALVKSGTTILYAHFNGKDLSLQTAEPVLPTRATKQARTSTGLSSLDHVEAQFPNHLSNYTYMDGALGVSTFPPTSVGLTGAEGQFGESAALLNQSYNPTGQQVCQLLHTLQQNRQLFLQRRPKHDLSLPDIIAERDKLANDLKGLERLYALYSDEWPEALRNQVTAQKGEIIPRLDWLRRWQGAMEQRAATQLALRRDQGRGQFEGQPISESKRDHSKNPLSPVAPAFIPTWFVGTIDGGDENTKVSMLPNRSRNNKQPDQLREGPSHSAPEGLGELPPGVERKVRFEENPMEQEVVGYVGSSEQSSQSQPTDRFSFLTQKATARREKSTLVESTNQLTMEQVRSNDGQAVYSITSATRNTPNTPSKGPGQEELRAVVVQGPSVEESYEWIQREHRIAHEHIQMMEAHHATLRQEYESRHMYEERLKAHKAFINELKSKADEKLARATHDLGAPTKTNKHPFAGNNAYNRHGYYALKSPSTLASPVFKASGGMIPSTSNAAQTAMSALPNQAQQTSHEHAQPALRPALRGGWWQQQRQLDQAYSHGEPQGHGPTAVTAQQSSSYSHQKEPSMRADRSDAHGMDRGHYQHEQTQSGSGADTAGTGRSIPSGWQRGSYSQDSSSYPLVRGHTLPGFAEASHMEQLSRTYTQPDFRRGQGMGQSNRQLPQPAVTSRSTSYVAAQYHEGSPIYENSTHNAGLYDSSHHYSGPYQNVNHRR